MADVAIIVIGKKKKKCSEIFVYALALLVLKWCVSGEQWTHQSSLNCKTQTQRAPEEERKKKQ